MMTVLPEGNPAPALCERCGTVLPREAIEGLCPRCLLETVVHLSPQGNATAESCASRAARSHGTVLPRPFGDYRLIEQLGQGGMGVVYKARQNSLGRTVALKMLPFGPFTRDEFIKRFQAEAQAAAKLQHPNIVSIFEVGEREGQHFFSMEFVDGPNLAELIGNQPMPEVRAVRLTRSIAEAVQFAHDHGIVHRDLKPSNILVDSLDQPKVTDFGLAKDLADDSELTLTGQTLGSPSYISPEQAEGRRNDLGPCSDVYSLGAILYHLLTGRPPFAGESITATVNQVINDEPVSPRLLNPSVSQDLEVVCLKCLEKESGRR
jgi:serine/threonine protein kinase